MRLLHKGDLLVLVSTFESSARVKRLLAEMNSPPRTAAAISLCPFGAERRNSKLSRTWADDKLLYDNK